MPCTNGKKIDPSGTPVIGIVANSSVVCVAFDDATIQILDFKSGWRRISSLVLSAPASRLSLNLHSMFMVVTACGHMNVWDLIKCRKVVSNESLLPLMNGVSGWCFESCMVCALLKSLRESSSCLFFSRLSSYIA